MSHTKSVNTLILVIVGIGILVSGCSSSGNKAQRTTSGSQASTAAPSAASGAITIGASPGAASALPDTLATDQGIFQKHGLSVNSLALAGGPAYVAAVLSGSIEITASSPSVVANAVQKGNDVAFFCGQALQNPNLVLVKPSSALKSAENLGGWQAALGQLAGKKVGVPARRGEIEARIRVALKSANVDPKGVTFIAVGVGPAAEAALTSGQVDALAGVEFFQRALLADGKAVSLGVTAGGPEGPSELQGSFGVGYMASRTWLKSHAALATAFCDSIKESIAYIQNSGNGPAVEALLKAKFGLSAEAAASAYKAVSAPGYLSAEMPQASVQKALQTLQTAGLLSASPAVRVDQIVAN